VVAHESGIDMDPQIVRYAATDEWVSLEAGVATVGITDFAVKALTDLVFIDLPARGRVLLRGEVFGVIESVKAASDMISPVSGEVVDVNDRLQEDLGLLSNDPFGAGWLIRVKVNEPALSEELMDRAAYERAWAQRHP
jgi:glycine cleavage system H protein